MTIGKLQSILAYLSSQGHAGKRVCIDKDTFWSPSDEASILDVHQADLDSFPMMQPDGGTLLESGNESCHTGLVLKGDEKQ